MGDGWCSGSLWLASGAAWKRAIEDFTEAAAGQRDGNSEADNDASLEEIYWMLMQWFINTEEDKRPAVMRKTHLHRKPFELSLIFQMLKWVKHLEDGSVLINICSLCLFIYIITFFWKVNPGQKAKQVRNCNSYDAYASTHTQLYKLLTFMANLSLLGQKLWGNYCWPTDRASCRAAGHSKNKIYSLCRRGQYIKYKMSA